MKQIDKVAREIKKAFCGRYNDYYKSLTIYLDTDDNILTTRFWGLGERFINHPLYLIPLLSYSTQYGDWGDEYGTERNWYLTKKVIASDLKNNIRRFEDEDSYFGQVNIPDWLRDEIEYYISKTKQ